MYLGETEVFRGDSPYRANPLIFYRVKQPANDLSKLPLLNLTKFYEQSKAEDEQIQFSIKKVSMGQGKKNYLDFISDEQTRKNLTDL